LTTKLGRCLTLIIPVVNVGGQYNHLIARMFTELGAQSQLVPIETTIEDVRKMKADALATGGGPQRIKEALREGTLGNLPNLVKQVDIPLLSICISHQLLGVIYGGDSGPASAPEFGPVEIVVDAEDDILQGLGPTFTAWGSHNDEVVRLPQGFIKLAHSENCRIQAMKHEKNPLYGLQFHPEVSHTEKGRLVFQNFLSAVKR
jgi:GMP synthase (glutamine-hydrolysing)